MKFTVSRTSVSNITVKPCEGAVLETVRRTDYREPFHTDKMWEEKGYGHCVVDGREQRFVKTKQWTIAFRGLAALLDFTTSYENVILYKAEGSLPDIEIYDDCRE